MNRSVTLYGPTGSGRRQGIRATCRRLDFILFSEVKQVHGRLGVADRPGAYLPLHEGRKYAVEYVPLSLAIALMVGFFSSMKWIYSHQRLLWGSATGSGRCAVVLAGKQVGKSFIRMKCSVSPARAIPTEEGIYGTLSGNRQNESRVA